MNACRPPSSAISSSPGRKWRWYVLASTISAPSARSSSGSTAFTVAFVPTGRNAGVRTSPCAVWRMPARAAPSRAVTVKESVTAFPETTPGSGARLPRRAEDPRARPARARGYGRAPRRGRARERRCRAASRSEQSTARTRRAARAAPARRRRARSPATRSRSAASSIVVDGLDVVAVGVEHEGADVARVVSRPQPRLAVARVARIDARLPEGIDLPARTRGEANMEMARHRMVVVSLRHRVVAPLVKGPARLHRPEAEHGEDDVVEPATRLLVGGADRDVVEHQRTSIASPKE